MMPPATAPPAVPAAAPFSVPDRFSIVEHPEIVVANANPAINKTIEATREVYIVWLETNRKG
jgi:hypothetical protein